MSEIAGSIERFTAALLERKGIRASQDEEELAADVFSRIRKQLVYQKERI